MNKLLGALTALFLTTTLFAQTYDPGFLDGRIMFRLLEDPVTVTNAVQKDVNDFSLDVDLSDYPEIEAVLNNVTVTRFEKPSYFTHKEGLVRIFRVHFNEYDKIDELVRELSKLSNVEYAEKEPIYTFDFIPNDTYHTGNSKWYHTLVGSESAWDISLGSNNIKVAIVDNAVFCGHSDITAYTQRDVADNDNDATPPVAYTSDFGWSHGTHCAGLATADINNGIGIASLGGNVEVIGVKTTPNSASNSGSVWYSYAGVQWACQNGANVVSMSYGGPSYSASMQALIDSYPSIVFFAAAGNDASTNLQYPGAYNNVICVGSVNSTDLRSSFSNYNGSTPYVDIASPGGYSYGGLYSTVYSSGGNSYAQMGGTSMATPFAAGLAGLMLSLNPTLSPATIENCLLTTGVNISQNIGPRIDALAALQCVQSTLTGDPLPYFYGTPLSIVEGDTVNFTDLSADGGNAITNWTWTFNGGTPSSYVGQNPPAIQYNTAGTYDVTLQVTNSQSTQSFTQTAYVNVSVPPYGEWIVENSGFTTASRGINHISIVDPNVVWATAYDGSGGGANVQEFTKTTDGGNSWTPGTINVQNSSLGISMITAVSSTTAWLAAYPTGGGQTGGIWKTTNGGTTWTRQNSALYNNSSSFTNVVHFWNANEGFCQGDPINGDFELYTTTNGGTTWTPVPGSSIPNPQSGNEFGYTRQIEVVGNNVWFTTSMGRMYHSTDKGNTWSVYNTPVPDFGGAVTSGSSANFSFSSATDGLIVDQAGNVYKTTNSGATWTQLTTTGTVHTNSLCFIEGTNTAFTTGAGTGVSGSSYSTDGGVTWNLIDTEQHLYVEFINPSIGWSGWFNTSSTADGMWKWNDLSSSMVADFSANALTVCTNTPVDFSDMTTGSTPISWQWVFNGGTPATSTAQNPTVTYASAGTYDVSLTVNDGTSQTTITQPSYITVVAPAATPSAITGNISICANSTESYSVVNDPGVVYNWTIPATWTGSSSSNAITVTADATSGTIEVTAENICGPSSPSTLAITVTPAAPTAGFNKTNIANDYTFVSTSTDATSWSWDFGDGGNSSVENPSYTYTANGTYIVTLTVTNGCGTDMITDTVTVTGVGLDELTSASVQLYPNPTEGEISIEVSDLLIGNAYVIRDVTGKIISKGTIKDLNTKINLSSYSRGVYFLKLEGTSITKRIIRK